MSVCVAHYRPILLAALVAWGWHHIAFHNCLFIAGLKVIFSWCNLWAVAGFPRPCFEQRCQEQYTNPYATIFVTGMLLCWKDPRNKASLPKMYHVASTDSILRRNQSPECICHWGRGKKQVEDLWCCLNNSPYPEKQVMQLGTQQRCLFCWRVYFGSQRGGGQISVLIHKYISSLFPVQPSELFVWNKAKGLLGISLPNNFF